MGTETEESEMQMAMIGLGRMGDAMRGDGEPGAWGPAWADESIGADGPCATPAAA